MFIVTLEIGTLQLFRAVLIVFMLDLTTMQFGFGDLPFPEYKHKKLPSFTESLQNCGQSLLSYPLQCFFALLFHSDLAQVAQWLVKNQYDQNQTISVPPPTEQTLNFH